MDRKTTTETAVIPHGNEAKTIRKIQDELCRKTGAVPTFPLFVRFGAGAEDIRDIESCSAEGISAGGKSIFIRASASTGRGEIRGAIQIAKDAEFPGRAEGTPASVRLPVFRVARVSFSEDRDGCEWEILSERWVKSRDIDGNSRDDADDAGA